MFFSNEATYSSKSCAFLNSYGNRVIISENIKCQIVFCPRENQTEDLLPHKHSYVVPWWLYLCIIANTDEHGTVRRLEIAPKDERDLERV